LWCELELNWLPFCGRIQRDNHLLKFLEGRGSRGFREIARFLILGMDEGEVGQSDESQDVP
jgi:hypothetical protein